MSLAGLQDFNQKPSRDKKTTSPLGQRLSGPDRWGKSSRALAKPAFSPTLGPQSTGRIGYSHAPLRLEASWTGQRPRTIPQSINYHLMAIIYEPSLVMPIRPLSSPKMPTSTSVISNRWGCVLEALLALLANLDSYQAMYGVSGGIATNTG